MFYLIQFGHLYIKWHNFISTIYAIFVLFFHFCISLFYLYILLVNVKNKCMYDSTSFKYFSRHVLMQEPNDVNNWSFKINKYQYRVNHNIKGHICCTWEWEINFAGCLNFFFNCIVLLVFRFIRLCPREKDRHFFFSIHFVLVGQKWLRTVHESHNNPEILEKTCKISYFLNMTRNITKLKEVFIWIVKFEIIPEVVFLANGLKPKFNNQAFFLLLLIWPSGSALIYSDNTVWSLLLIESKGLSIAFIYIYTLKDFENAKIENNKII